MKNFQLYVGGTNNITYRYEIHKMDDAFSVRIFNVIDKAHKEVGAKLLRSVSSHDVIDECVSHYKRQAQGVKGFLRWLGL
ncbi:TPA: hypothetical protein IBF34_002768 [Escherichia coli]|uniref:hypothetical protein n=1 Tax=Escherichia coli TaxID=562 RepID=UPI000539980F|nr:hypothetical protein [Escherichia coli]EER0913125.1 hypothetical protein [Escherichia coli O168:H8]EES8552706.1 hypothetical protein [Escherichia coli O168]EKE4532920.1 hypothetical protein [Escherichia coli O157]EKE4540837.1 hypothetical protein [Escherichia coli O103]EKM2494471.1 hypothetical protein [Escherichia coli O26]MCM7434140.1 hypothetical protein [Enterobacter hormaechei]